MRALLIGTIALASLSVTAMANDQTARNESAKKVDFDWTGFYFGAGGRFTQFEDTDTLFPNFVSSGKKYNASAFAGVNYQMNDIVVGLEADFTRMDADFTTTQIPAVVNDIYSVKAKFGAAADRFLLYLSAGGSYTSVTATYPFGIGNVDLKGYGTVIGFGADYAFTDHIFAGFEFQRHFFNNFGKDQIPPAFAGLQAIDADVNIYSLRLGYKF